MWFGQGFAHTRAPPASSFFSVLRRARSIDVLDLVFVVLNYFEFPVSEILV